MSDLQKIENNLFEIDNYKRDLDIDLSEKQDRLKEIDIEEVRQLESLKDKYKNKLSTIEQSIGSKKRNLDILKRELQDVELKLKKYGTEDIRIQRLSKHQEFSDELIKLCTSKLKEYEDESKKTIAVKVNQTLQQFSRKDFTIKVSEDFSFYLIREDGQKVAKSRGENLLLNLSFVSALIEFAQMRSGASGEFLVKGTTAPFVIDAPFGELDNTYKQATAEFLPKRSRQLIFLLSSSHWIGTVDDTIKNLVGEEYILISSKSSLQKNKPEDLITINKKEYIQSMYNQPKDATFIERID